MTIKNSKVIFDTNVWVSFLIGKRLLLLADTFQANKLLL